MLSRAGFVTRSSNAPSPFKEPAKTRSPTVFSTGKLSPDVLEQMHRQLRAWLPLDDIKTCCHVEADVCACRKPRPGMLLEAAREQRLDLGRSFMVGDRWRDVSAGKAAGCQTIFVNHGYAETLETPPDFVVTSLLEASRIILQHEPEPNRNP